MTTFQPKTTLRSFDPPVTLLKKMGMLENKDADGPRAGLLVHNGRRVDAELLEEPQ